MIRWLRRRWAAGARRDADAGTSEIADLDRFVRFHRLHDWWLEAFSAAERRHIALLFAAYGRQPGRATYSEVTNCDTRFGFLSTLLAAVATRSCSDLAGRVFDKALASAGAGTRIVERHFLFQRYLESALAQLPPDAGPPPALLQRCREMVAFAPEAARVFVAHGEALPAHAGYEALGAALEYAGVMDEACRLYQQARAEGWNGRWADAIARCSSGGD